MKFPYLIFIKSLVYLFLIYVIITSTFYSFEKLIFIYGLWLIFFHPYSFLAFIPSLFCFIVIPIIYFFNLNLWAELAAVSAFHLFTIGIIIMFEEDFIKSKLTFWKK